MLQNQHMNTNQLPESERPYEKCERYGAAYLTDAELLAVILRTGTRKERAVELAARILLESPDGSLIGLNRLTFAELMKIPGIGRVKAAEILCVLEFAKRMARSAKQQRPKFCSPEDVAGYYMQQLRADITEKVYLLTLDTKGNLIKEILLSSGSFNASLLAPREVFYEALRQGAVSVILIHNHPSGDPTPSKQDVVVTRRIAQAGQLMGIFLSDHVIIGDNCFISMKEMGYLQEGE